MINTRRIDGLRLSSHHEENRMKRIFRRSAYRGANAWSTTGPYYMQDLHSNLVFHWPVPKLSGTIECKSYRLRRAIPSSPWTSLQSWPRGLNPGPVLLARCTSSSSWSMPLYLGKDVCVPALPSMV
ncbi:hypothetical protein PM082_008154 [Marasmius tenuissimus]|nr:hypothetical protein PM082_008154 [Marasmius tenuissimus]